jgi:hypothetical protein
MKTIFQQMTALFPFKPLPSYSYSSNQVITKKNVVLATHHITDNNARDMCGDISCGNKQRVMDIYEVLSGLCIIMEKFRVILALKLVGLTLKTESEKIDAIASKFSLVHDNTLLSELSTSFNDDPSSYTYTSLREIKNLIKKLKSGKTTGCDEVPNMLLNNTPRRAAVSLTYIFNSCLKLCYFPKQWSHATVIPIPKPGKDHSDSSN